MLPSLAEALWEQLEPLLPGLSVEVVPEIASTNSALLARARGLPGRRADDAVADPRDELDAAGPALVRRSVESAAFGRRAVDLQPALLVAETQTAGRGRQGRPWQSATGASLTFSLALPLKAADWAGLSLAVGVALCEALDPPSADGRTRLALKWPNDLWLMEAPGRGRKLGGVLIETLAAGPQRLAVIGIGLNVRPFDAGAVGTGFAAWQEIEAADDASALLLRLARPLVEALQRFEQHGFAAFAAAFDARDLLRGHRVRTVGDAPVEGTADGISAAGGLLLATEDGTREIQSGEVSVRLAAEMPSC